MKISVLVITGCIFANFLMAQQFSTTNKKAISLYQDANVLLQQRKYESAINLLEQAIAKEQRFWEAHLRLANIFKMLIVPNKTKYYLTQACTYNPNQNDMIDNYIFLAELYFKNQKYDSSMVWLENSLELKPTETQIKKIDKLSLNNRFAQSEISQQQKIKKNKLHPNINAYFTQSYPVLTADSRAMLYTKRNSLKPTDSEDIVMSIKENGIWSKAVSLSDSINSVLNEGVASISGDGKTMVFTACNRQECLNKSCDIFIAHKRGSNWSKPQNMGSLVNSNYWDSEPTLSADGRTLYFSSDRKDGLGKEDIWVSKQDENGSWQKAQNLGNTINTADREVSPFIYSDSKTLFFSSDSRIGMGGFDIFYSITNEINHWSEPVNVGLPINSPENDNSIFITTKADSIYYTVYDVKSGVETYPRSFIYSMPTPNKLKNIFSKNIVYQGKVVDAETDKIVPASIELINLVTQQVEQKVSIDSENDLYTLVVTAGKEYALRVSAKGYWFHSMHIKDLIPNDTSAVLLNIELKPLKSGKGILLNNVFFESDKFILDKKSKSELDALAKLLLDNNTAKVLLAGHTDNQGGDEYNQKLSLNRAEEVKKYLFQLGISKDRIIAKGYGNTKPLNKNTTDEEKAKNRRIEITLL